MNRNTLEAYQANKRSIESNKKRIEDEQFKDIPVVKGKVTGSSHEFPYIARRFTVEMDEPIESERQRRRIAELKEEIRKAEEAVEAVEQFIAGITDARHREIFEYRYIDGMEVQKVANKVGYTHGRVSQIITKCLKD